MRLLVPTYRHLRLQQPVMHTLLRLVADAMAVVLMAVIAVVSWVVVQLGGGGVLLASLLAFPACGLLAAAIHHVQRWACSRRPPHQPNPHGIDRGGLA
ncbi:hypothetical protein ACIP8U_38800 [Streptomyces pseudovenezuelae]|uniref:hypothetical protein n=1 Tax=Streptomyces pseudovenezuelae TaxID=67350 RepID=UPI00382A68DF